MASGALGVVGVDGSPDGLNYMHCLSCPSLDGIGLLQLLVCGATMPTSGDSASFSNELARTVCPAAVSSLMILVLCGMRASRHASKTKVYFAGAV